MHHDNCRDAVNNEWFDGITTDAWQSAALARLSA